MPRKPAFLSALAEESRALSPRDALREISRGFKENDLLTYASAISFRVFFALIPLSLLALGLLGSFGLTEVWKSDVAPGVQERVSGAGFEVIDQTVQDVLGQKQFFWATAGALLAVWMVSSGMRAVMGVLDRIYRVDEERPWLRRVIVSLWLSALVTAMLFTAIAAAKVLPRIVEGAHVTIAGWAVAVLLLTATVAVIVRFAPNKERPLQWVSFGALLVTAGWMAGSLLYAWYATSIADYGSVFGGLAAVMVTLGYIYLSSIVFLTGLQLDALIRDAVEDEEADERQAPHLLVAPTLASAEH